MTKNKLSFFFCLVALFAVTTLHAQSQQVDNTPAIHHQFPYQMMWDDAVMQSVATGKPTVAFDLDLADSASVKIAQSVIRSKRLQSFLNNYFIVALNDFASDPPPSVGLDSLRNLGWRLSGLEKTYGIVKRPCIIVLGKDKLEIDRIALPQGMNTMDLEKRLNNIMMDRNTLRSERAKFWDDTTNIEQRWKIIGMFEQRSKYDSVIRHLSVIRNDKQHATDAKRAWFQLGLMRMQMEGVTEPIKSFIATLTHKNGEDTIAYGLMEQLINFYETKRQPDSVIAMYNMFYAFSGKRDADMLNEEAWYLANKSSKMEEALTLVDEALSRNPKSADYLDTRALIEAHLGRYDDAIRDEEQAMALARKGDKKEFKQQLQYIKSLKQESEADKLEESKDASNTH